MISNFPIIFNYFFSSSRILWGWGIILHCLKERNICDRDKKENKKHKEEEIISCPWGANEIVNLTEEMTHRVGENICQLYIRQSTDNQNIQGT
jgi:hypothetical protein